MSANEEVNVLRKIHLKRFSSRLEFCAKEMRAKLFRRTNCETSFQLKTGRNFGAFIVLTSVKLCKLGDESKGIFAAAGQS